MNGDGVLQYPEVLGLTNELYQNFGLQQPSEAGQTLIRETRSFIDRAEFLVEFLAKRQGCAKKRDEDVHFEKAVFNIFITQGADDVMVGVLESSS
eukprot:1683802-Amphidinium_carterae.1